MRVVTLSKRLKAVADLLKSGPRVADVGCDHGFVSIYLVQIGGAEHIIAMDVNDGPLRYAAEHVREYHMESYIELRKSDGLHELAAGEADGMIIAGMGGKLMIRILSENWEKASVMKAFVLQPQSEIDEVRAYLLQQNCRIVEEDMVYEDGKYYMMMRVIPPNASDERLEVSDIKNIDFKDIPERMRLLYGEYLIATHHPVLEQYLQYRKDMYRRILEQFPTDGNESRREELAQEIAGIEAIEQCWKNG